jgi:hypothetical protein
MYGRVHARTLLHGLGLGNCLTGSGHSVRHIGRGYDGRCRYSLRCIPPFRRLAMAERAAQDFRLILKEPGPISDFGPYLRSTRSSGGKCAGHLATSMVWAAVLLGSDGTETPLRLRCHPLGMWQSGDAGTSDSAKAHAATVLTYGRPNTLWLALSSALCLAIATTVFKRRRLWI